MPGLWFYNDPIDRLHQWALRRDKARYTGTPRHKRQELTRRAVALIKKIVEPWGYRVTETTHKCPFDLWVEGVRVEIKASTFNDRTDRANGGRYIAHIKNHEADLVIFDCINGTDHLHIIPMADVAPRKSIAIYTYDPAVSSGMWQPYLGQWDCLHRAVELSNHTWQPPLF